MKRRSSTAPDTPGTLYVTDGTIAAGTIEHDGKDFLAFDGDGRLIGMFATSAAAMAAFPRVPA